MVAFIIQKNNKSLSKQWLNIIARLLGVQTYAGLIEE